eukprot:403359955
MYYLNITLNLFQLENLNKTVPNISLTQHQSHMNQNKMMKSFNPADFGRSDAVITSISTLPTDRSHTPNKVSDHNITVQTQVKSKNQSPTKMMVLSAQDNGMLAELVKASASFLADHFSPDKKRRMLQGSPSKSPIKKQQILQSQGSRSQVNLNRHKRGPSKENIDMSFAADTLNIFSAKPTTSKSIEKSQNRLLQNQKVKQIVSIPQRKPIKGSLLQNSKQQSKPKINFNPIEVEQTLLHQSKATVANKFIERALEREKLKLNSSTIFNPTSVNNLAHTTQSKTPLCHKILPQNDQISLHQIQQKQVFNKEDSYIIKKKDEYDQYLEKSHSKSRLETLPAASKTFQVLSKRQNDIETNFGMLKEQNQKIQELSDVNEKLKQMKEKLRTFEASTSQARVKPEIHNTIPIKQQTKPQVKTLTSDSMNQQRKRTQSNIATKSRFKPSPQNPNLKTEQTQGQALKDSQDVEACGDLDKQITIDYLPQNSTKQQPHKTSLIDKSNLESAKIEPLQNQSLEQQLKTVIEKMLKYMKEINFTTIIDFKSQDDNPSKSCFRAARCLCLLISAFHDQPQKGQQQLPKKSSDFNQWSEIKQYINANSHKIAYNISSIQQKCDSKQFNINKIKQIYNDIFLMMDEQIESQSPRIRNQQYKPVFCFVFFTINYILISQKIDQQKNKQAALQAIQDCQISDFKPQSILTLKDQQIADVKVQDNKLNLNKQNKAKNEQKLSQRHSFEPNQSQISKDFNQKLKDEDLDDLETSQRVEVNESKPVQNINERSGSVIRVRSQKQQVTLSSMKNLPEESCNEYRILQVKPNQIVDQNHQINSSKHDSKDIPLQIQDRQSVCSHNNTTQQNQIQQSQIYEQQEELFVDELDKSIGLSSQSVSITNSQVSSARNHHIYEHENQCIEHISKPIKPYQSLIPPLNLNKQVSFTFTNEVLHYKNQNEILKVINETQIQSDSPARTSPQKSQSKESGFKINLQQLQLINDSFQETLVAQIEYINKPSFQQVESPNLIILQGNDNQNLNTKQQLMSNENQLVEQASPNQKLVECMKNGTKNKESLSQESLLEKYSRQSKFQNSSNINYSYSKVDESQKSLVQQMLDVRRKSQERRKGGQLERNTQDIIKELSKSFIDKQ